VTVKDNQARVILDGGLISDTLEQLLAVPQMNSDDMSNAVTMTVM